MKLLLRATNRFLDEVRRDLRRPHPFAAERVGFVTTRAARGHDHMVLIAQAYHPVADADYLDDPRVGAMMGSEAIRKALEIALRLPVGMFHIHLHDHEGDPGFSAVDRREQLKFVPDFFKVRAMPHGALVLSADSIAGRTWLAPDTIVDITEFEIVGPHTRVIRPSSVDITA